MTAAVQLVRPPGRGNRTSLPWDRAANASSPPAAPARPEPQEAPYTPFELWDMYGIGSPGGEGGAGRPAARSAVARHGGNGDVGRRAQRHSSSAGSLCVEGKFVPELYVLGYPKCGTTTLADDLRDAGVRSNAEPIKEAHHFELQFALGTSYSDISSTWFAAHENCSETEPKRVIGDYTPDNMRLVPPPEDWEVEYLDSVTDGNYNLPLLFTSYLYRAASPRLTFAVMVRETLARFQSSWYFYNFVLNDHPWLSANGTFSTVVRNSIEKATSGTYHYYVFRIWGGLYGRHLEQWLKYFHPSQFYYIPFLDYVRPGGKTAVFGALEERLGISIPATGHDDASHHNSNSHPSLDEDLPPDLQAEFRAFVEPEVEYFVELLAGGSTQGLGLANFSGTPGSAADVREWLEAGW